MTLICSRPKVPVKVCATSPPEEMLLTLLLTVQCKISQLLSNSKCSKLKSSLKDLFFQKCCKLPQAYYHVISVIRATQMQNLNAIWLSVLAHVAPSKTILVCLQGISHSFSFSLSLSLSLSPLDRSSVCQFFSFDPVCVSWPGEIINLMDIPCHDLSSFLIDRSSVCHSLSLFLDRVCVNWSGEIITLMDIPYHDLSSKKEHQLVAY